MIYGVGIDLVEISRITESLEKFPESFAAKVFTQAEREYCDPLPTCAQHYAARFAAKEAFLKALGLGKSHGISWQDVAVEKSPGGKPSLAITGAAAEITGRLGISGFHLSLTHTGQHAAAVVVLETDGSAAKISEKE